MKAEDALYHRTRPSVALPRAAELELFKPRQGEGFFERWPLAIEVSLGDQDLRDEDGFGFSLHFRRVIVALLLERCELAWEGRYERTLPAEDFAQFLKRVVDKSRIAKGQAAGGVSKILSSVLSSVGIDVSAHAEVAASLERGDTQTIESKIDFKIVRYVPGARWEIGHPTLGDPSEIEGFLRGSYLREPADGRTDDDYNPLCTLNPVSRRPYSVTVELRAKISDCEYFPLGDEPGGQAWAKRNRKQIERLLVLKMLKESNRDDQLDLPEDEIILARTRLDVRSLRRRREIDEKTTE